MGVVLPGHSVANGTSGVFMNWEVYFTVVQINHDAMIRNISHDTEQYRKKAQGPIVSAEGT